MIGTAPKGVIRILLNKLSPSDICDISVLFDLVSHCMSLTSLFYFFSDTKKEFNSVLVKVSGRLTKYRPFGNR